MDSEDSDDSSNSSREFLIELPMAPDASDSECSSMLSEGADHASANLANANIPVALAKYSLPSIFSLIVENVIDLFTVGLIGNVGGALSLARKLTIYNVASPTEFIPYSFGIGIGMSVSSLVSHAVARYDLLACRRLIAKSYVLCAIAACLCLLFIPVLGLILPAMGCPEALLSHATTYGRIALCAAPFAIYTSLFENLLRAYGRTKSASAVPVFTVIINVIFNLIATLALHAHIYWVAVAPIVSNLCGCLLGFFLFRHATDKASPSFTSLFDSDFFSLFKLSFSNFSVNLLYVTDSIIITSALSGATSGQFQDNIVASAGIALKMIQLVMNLSQGIGEGALPMLSFFLGAKRSLKFNKTCSYSAIYMVCITTPFAILLLCAPKVFSNLFVDGNVDLLDLVVAIVRRWSPLLFVSPIYILSITVLGAYHRNIYILSLLVARLTVQLSMSIAGSVKHDYDIVLWSMPVCYYAASLVAASMLVFLVISKKKHKMRNLTSLA